MTKIFNTAYTSVNLVQSEIFRAKIEWMVHCIMLFTLWEASNLKCTQYAAINTHGSNKLHYNNWHS